MENDVLQQAYDPEAFRRQGHALIDQLADHLSGVMSGMGPVLEYREPTQEWEDWETYLKEGNPADLFPKMLERTTQVHHPRCVGHQVAPPMPLASLAALLSGVQNNGMAIYEMGMAPTAMERLLTDWLCRKAGFGPDARGFLTCGGTLANLTALLAARRARGRDDVWNQGYSARHAVLVSAAAHYCIDRAARIMGMGSQGVILVPVDSEYRMDPAALEVAYTKALEDGLEPIAVVGSAPSTATGSYDPLAALADFSEKHGLWFHIDGAHGGAAFLSEQYRHLVRGLERADSVVIDGHKMMGMPVLTTALLFRNGADSYATFSQQAEYLLGESQEEDWYNLAKRTFECTKISGVFSWFAVWKHYGEGVFAQYLERQYHLAREVAALITDRPEWELACPPDANILCFRYRPEGLDGEATNQLNQALRQAFLEEGRFYVVQTRLKGEVFLRTSLMNPFTRVEDLSALLALAEQQGQAILAKGN
ncbi:aminotransferase class I/II-fold pyridoxal phosphate-dependent enzyme [Robiginitalea sp. M366]|uniref:pyridoxal phosphate-dependent decarboxylase family protein n=1 Tax=Robiginitalea aestuariiviva TaxID=3036903 RepID=UPI00240D1912|nr:aminotransferase class I/II-fold pyridoxal phosphate-dependent enzyme [Robiginitalea aestuariiviva]MDG1573455.1 aminotransferase class I/II-fold pyridoxal phosphate-dependent enzyme [Robiginitalea aestuariiviva]